VGLAQDARRCPLGVAWNSPYCSTEHHCSIFILQLTLGNVDGSYMMLETLDFFIQTADFCCICEAIEVQAYIILFFLSSRQLVTSIFLSSFFFFQ
jgi:hypothetical protein